MGNSLTPRLRVALIGSGFMGAAHSQAWRVAPRFFDLPLAPEMSILVGHDSARTTAAAEKFGWADSSTDWRRVVESPDVDLVDICTPGDTHRDIAVAALAAGKHVLCEKPLANTVPEAEEMAAAATVAAAAGVRSMVGFSYRRVPAFAFARQLVAEGKVGAVRQVRVQYLQDWLVDENGPMTWRLDKSRAGSGSLGDIGAHAIDMAEFITGSRIESTNGLLHTFVTERPLLGESVGLSGIASDERGVVTVDDVALFTSRLSNGALASFEATRYATGRKNAFRVEISGSRGAIAVDLERMNELEYYDATLPNDLLGFRRIYVTEPEHPYMSAWWPTGHTIGYEHSFTHQARDLVVAIATGEQPRPSFDDGLHVQRVLAAVEQSSDAGGDWVQVEKKPVA